LSATAKDGIRIAKLDIAPASQINQLAYRDNQISFCLQASQEDLERCLPDNSSPRKTPAKNAIAGTLQILWGQPPLTLTLGFVNVPELNLKANLEDPQEISLQFTPEPTSESTLSLTYSSHLYLDVPEPQRLPENNAKWIGSDIEVENVRFTQLDLTENVLQGTSESTILDGEVRMGRETMKLQPSQFLLIPRNYGIRRLKFIQIQSASSESSDQAKSSDETPSPAGLKTLFAGKSTMLEVGLYKNYPVQSIKPSFLSKFLPPDGVNAILAIVAALTAVFLPNLL
jgi:hypothetical protein